MSNVVKDNKNYDNSSIGQLKGAERFRMRPEMLLGSRNLLGAQHGIWEIIGNSLDEALSGYGRTLKLGLRDDGSVYVRDYGRGVPMGWNEKEQNWNFRLIYMEMYAGGKLSKNQDILHEIDDNNQWDTFDMHNYNYLITIGLNGVGAAATIGTSEYAEVHSYRDGVESSMRFMKGVNLWEQPAVQATDELNGTLVIWKPDATVFTDVNITSKWLESLAKSISFIAGLTVVFDNKGTETIYEAGNMKEEMSSVTGGAVYSHVFKHIVDQEGDVCICDAEIVIGPEGRKNEYYHNRVEMTGGAHYSGYTDGVAGFFSDISREKGIRIRAEDYSGKLSVIISTLANKASLRNQTKDCIDDTWIALFLRDAVYKLLNEEYNKGCPWLMEAVEKTLADARARIAASEMVKNVREIEKSTTKHKTSHKFVTCRTYEQGDTEATEFFIVEGDSAMGSVLSGRSANFQCVLPIRGKSLNLYKASIEKLVHNREILDIISILGTGIELNIDGYASFDMDKLKCGKIIFCADADQDGKHIVMLLFLIIWKLFRPLLSTGRVYIATPPLYGVETYSQGMVYCNDDDELNALRDAGEVKNLIRFKGLGEMDGEELWNTTLNPASRHLRQVVVSDDDMAVYDTLEVLFGRSTEARKKAILGSMLGTDYEETIDEMTSLSELIDSMELDADLDVEEIEY